MESIDLLVELLEAHKPHLKPYSERLKSWIDLLEEYNDVAGTHYKQSRTLKKRFERVVDAYRVDKSLPTCQNVDLLSKLIDEYNKPYRLLQKSDYGQTNVSNHPHQNIQVDPSLYITQISTEENENENIDSQHDNGKINSSTFIQSQYDNPMQTIREEENEPIRNVNGNQPHTIRKKLKQAKGRVEKISEITTDGTRSRTINDINNFNMDDLLRSEEQSKESSTQPLPLDTIALGMPRTYEESDDKGCSSDSAVTPAVMTRPARYNPTSSNSTNKSRPTYYQSIKTNPPKSIFIIDQNNKLVELTSLNSSNIVTTSTTSEPEQTRSKVNDYNGTNNFITHNELPATISLGANSLMQSTRQGKVSSSKRHDKSLNPLKFASSSTSSSSSSSHSQESQFLTELNGIRKEQQNFQNMITARLDTITDLLLKVMHKAKPIATSSKTPARTKNIHQSHR